MTVHVDWNELRRKLDEVGALLSETMQVTAAQGERVLSDRAARLREVPRGLAVRQSIVEVLAFERAEERFAIELSTLHSVQPWVVPAQLPGAPPWVWGMVNVRGDIIAVVDLGDFLDGAGRDRPPEHMVVAAVRAGVGDERRDLGFVALPADRITGILPVDSSRLAPALHTFSDRKRQLVRGLLPDGTLLLELGDTFSSHEITT